MRGQPRSLLRRAGRARSVLVDATLVALGAALLTSCGGGTPALGALSGKSAAQILNESLTLVNQIGSFHYVAETTGTGATVLVQGDAGTMAGNQTVTDNSSGTAQTTQVRSFSRVVYLNASAEVLTQLLGLSSNAAAANAGKWISIPAADSHYKAIADSVTYQGELANFVPIGTLQLGKVSTVQGKKVVAISGSPAPAAAGGAQGTVTLYITINSPFLPAGATVDLTEGSQQLKEAAAFTEWGEAVVPSVPPAAIPAASLGV